MNRPTRTIFTGFGICLVSALWLTFAKAASGDQEFDMACAVSSAAEVGVNGMAGEAGQAAFLVNVYYLGRLSGRDSQTYWSAVVKGKVAELRQKARSPDMYGRCMDFMTKQL